MAPIIEICNELRREMTNEASSDSDSEPEVPKLGAAKHLYDAKKHMCVPDMRSLCHLPADADDTRMKGR